jgi:hypothetical protein
MKTLTLQQEDFKKGLQLLDDDSKADFGSARKMLNILISDRGGITTRPGTELLGGSYDTSGYRTNGFYTFRKTLGTEEWPLTIANGSLYFYDATSGWQLLKSGYTADADFGFTFSLVNTDSEGYTYFSNRYDEYQRWRGSVTRLNGALVGAETTITVDSTLKPEVYESKTATSSSATTLGIGTTPWTNDMWIGFYVHITSGVHEGKIRLISDNTTNGLVFDTLGSDPGSCTFQIRQINFPTTGTLIYNSTTIAYTGIDKSTTFTVASAHAASDNTPIAIVPEVYAGNPRGDKIESLLGRVLVGNVRSAMARDSGGTLQGSAQSGSVFVSKILNPTDFTFAATRVAGEGDIINMPYGGGPINDIKALEEYAYVYKKDYIEAIKYTGDADDIAIRTPIKTGVGSVGRVIKGADDHFFMTVDKQYTSIGRVYSKDNQPQTKNLGLSIKRLLEEYDHSDFNGIEFKNRIISCHKSSPDNDDNDVMLVRNLQTNSFEGVWTLPARFFDKYSDDLYYADSTGRNVWEMFKDFKYDKIDSDTLLPFTSEWQSNFFNLLPIKSNLQGVNSIAIEGYISAGTTFTFSLYKDFSSTASVEFDFGGTEDDFLQGDSVADFLGANPLGLQPLGTIDAPGSDGRRRFSFIVYVPYVYGQYFSNGFRSSGVRQDWEIIRCSLGLKESVSARTSNTKTI